MCTECDFAKLFYPLATHRKQFFPVCIEPLILADRPEGSIDTSAQPASHLSLLT